MVTEARHNGHVLENGSRTPYADLIEIAVGYSLLLATIWSALPVRAYFGWLTVVWLIVALLRGAQRISSLGLGLRGLRKSFWAVGLALLGTSIIVACAAALGTLHYHRNIRSPFVPVVGYLIWSFVQQFILQNMFFLRLLRLLKSPALAVCIGGLLLSLAHLPNLLLVAATLLWGIWACWLFLHYRSLYTVGIIHFLLGVSLAACVPSSLQHNMRVGWGYTHQPEVYYAAPSVVGSGSSRPAQHLSSRTE